MIKWCCYCQAYIGEKPPFNDYTFSHGVCVSCKHKVQTQNLELHSAAKTQLLKSIFLDYMNAVYRHEVIDLSALSIRRSPRGLNR